MNTQTLIQIQDEYIHTILDAAFRWSHKPGTAGYRFGGHFPRISAAARRKATHDLKKIGLTEEQIERTIRDALEVAWLEFDATEDGVE